MSEESSHDVHINIRPVSWGRRQRSRSRQHSVVLMQNVLFKGLGLGSRRSYRSGWMMMRSQTLQTLLDTRCWNRRWKTSVWSDSRFLLSSRTLFTGYWSNLTLSVPWKRKPGVPSRFSAIFSPSFFFTVCWLKVAAATITHSQSAGTLGLRAPLLKDMIQK